MGESSYVPTQLEYGNHHQRYSNDHHIYKINILKIIIIYISSNIYNKGNNYRSLYSLPSPIKPPPNNPKNPNITNNKIIKNPDKKYIRI